MFNRFIYIEKYFLKVIITVKIIKIIVLIALQIAKFVIK